MGNEQGKDQKKPLKPVDKNQLDILLKQIFFTAQLNKDRRRGQQITREKELLALVRQPVNKRSKDNEYQKASALVNDAKWIKAHELLMRYADILKDNVMVIELSKGDPSKINDLLPYVESIVYGCQKCNVSGVSEFENFIINCFGLDVHGAVMLGSKVTAEMKACFGNILPSEREVKLYLLDFCRQNGIDHAVLNELGHDIDPEALSKPEPKNEDIPPNNGGFPNNQGGFPNNQGGFPNQGFPNNQGGFPNQPFPNNQGGFPNQPFPNNQGGYPNQPFPNNQGGFPNNQGGYPQYPNNQGGYPQPNYNQSPYPQFNQQPNYGAPYQPQQQYPQQPNYQQNSQQPPYGGYPQQGGNQGGYSQGGNQGGYSQQGGNQGGYSQQGGNQSFGNNNQGPQSQNFGGYQAPPQNSGYKAPSQNNGGYQAPTQSTGNYQAPTQNSGYQAPPQNTGGYQAPPQNSGYQKQPTNPPVSEQPKEDNGAYPDFQKFTDFSGKPSGGDPLDELDLRLKNIKGGL